MPRAELFAKRLKSNLAVIIKRRPEPDVSEVTHIVGDVDVAARDESVPWPELAALEVRFHDAVARATGNSVRAAIMAAILDALERAFTAVPVAEGSPLRGQLGPELHEILKAIHAGDDEAAGEAMRAHVARWSELEVEHSP